MVDVLFGLLFVIGATLFVILVGGICYLSIREMGVFSTWQGRRAARRHANLPEEVNIDEELLSACVGDQVERTTCCGMYEMYDLAEGPPRSLAALALAIRNWNYKPMVVFTDAVQYGNGIALAKYIQDKRLGTVVTIPPSYNPNSGHRVQAWLWRINKRRWKKWVAKNVVGG